MAKPIIYFKGVRYKAGANEGWRPSLEKAAKVSDLALAEEICIEKRLSLSPDELLYAVRTAIETAPQLVAADGRVREFTNLLCFNRTASGKLAGPGGAWNDTCQAKVKAQLKKDTKLAIDATFQNEISLPVPKVDNVTWIGAQSVINVVKTGNAFAAYGRNMQFDAGKGDTAKLVLAGGTDKALACTSSDASHAVFAWPAGLVCEDGTGAEFRMVSRAGIEGGAACENRKSVVVLDDRVEVKIDTLAARNEGGHTVLTLTGSHLDGARGYTQAGGTHRFTVTADVNRSSPEEVQMTSPDGTTFSGTLSGTVAQTGDEVLAIFEVDPAKTQYKQGWVGKETTVA